MKANELRIGNLVLNEYLEPVFLIGILPHKLIVSKNGDWDEDCKDLTYRDIEPIPLTKKRIIDFGIEFEKDYSAWIKGSFNLESKNGKFYFEVYSHYKLIKYVHQLQNLYFALTGEELTI